MRKACTEGKTEIKLILEHKNEDVKKVCITHDFIYINTKREHASSVILWNPFFLSSGLLLYTTNSLMPIVRDKFGKLASTMSPVRNLHYQAE